MVRLPRPLRPLALLRAAAFLLLALFLAWGAYACAGHRALQREIRDTPRDPATGVVRGAEARTLDPPASHDAPTTACLLLHGFVGSRRDFGELGERLAAAGFHVDMMRLPGHGVTPPEFARQTPESMIQAVAEEFRALKRRYRAVHVVGFSMGGSLATLLAAREPVDRLVLAAPYYGVTYQWWYLLPAETWNAALGPVVPYVLKSDAFKMVNRREAADEIYCYHCVPTRGAATLMELGRRAFRPETLAAIRCPTLMIASETDGAASPRCMRAAFDRLKNAPKEALWIDPRNNHHIFWDYDREATIKAVVDFLGRP